MACTIHNTAARDAALTILAGRGQVSNELVYAHVKYKLNQSQGEMHIRRIPSNRRRTDFNVRAVELYLAAATRPHHLRNVDPTLALV